MTNLTDKWKKGELPSGWYYVRLIRGEYRIDLYINGKKEWIDCPDNIIDTVVCKVPSYEEWQAKLEENAQLKELLKECELWFTGVVGNMNDKNCGEHNRNLPIGNFEHIFKVFSQKINQVLGE